LLAIAVAAGDSRALARREPRRRAPHAGGGQPSLLSPHRPIRFHLARVWGFVRHAEARPRPGPARQRIRFANARNSQLELAGGRTPQRGPSAQPPDLHRQQRPRLRKHRIFHKRIRLRQRRGRMVAGQSRHVDHNARAQLFGGLGFDQRSAGNLETSNRCERRNIPFTAPHAGVLRKRRPDGVPCNRNKRPAFGERRTDDQRRGSRRTYPTRSVIYGSFGWFGSYSSVRYWWLCLHSQRATATRSTTVASFAHLAACAASRGILQSFLLRSGPMATSRRATSSTTACVANRAAPAGAPIIRGESVTS